MTHASTPPQHNNFLTSVINTKLIDTVRRLSLAPTFILGVNLSEAAITELGNRYHQIQLTNLSLESLLEDDNNFRDGHFDTVIANLAVGQDIDVDSVLKKIERLVNKQGIFIFITFDHTTLAALKKLSVATYDDHYIDEGNLIKNEHVKEQYEFELHKVHLLQSDNKKQCVDGQIIILFNKHHATPGHKFAKLPPGPSADAEEGIRPHQSEMVESAGEMAEAEPAEVEETGEGEEETNEATEEEISEAGEETTEDTAELLKSNTEAAQALLDSSTEAAFALQEQNKEDNEMFDILNEELFGKKEQELANLERLREGGKEAAEQESPENAQEESGGDEGGGESEGEESSEEEQPEVEEEETETPHAEIPNEAAQPEVNNENLEPLETSAHEQAESYKSEPEEPENAEELASENSEALGNAETAEAASLPENDKSTTPEASPITYTSILETLNNLEANLTSQLAALNASPAPHAGHDSSATIFEALDIDINPDEELDKKNKSSLLAAYHQNIASHKSLLSTLIQSQEKALNPELNSMIENHKKVLKEHEEKAKKLQFNPQTPTLEP